MTNECNILIYSVFIFFCYSFIILNMALPLFHIVKPLNYLVCFESVVCGPEHSFRTDSGCRISGIFRASCTAGGAGAAAAYQAHFACADGGLRAFSIRCASCADVGDAARQHPAGTLLRAEAQRY